MASGIAQHARRPEPVVERGVDVPVDPELGAGLLDERPSPGDERRAGVLLYVSRVDRPPAGRVMSHHDRCANVRIGWGFKLVLKPAHRRTVEAVRVAGPQRSASPEQVDALIVVDTASAGPHHFGAPTLEQLESRPECAPQKPNGSDRDVAPL